MPRLGREVFVQVESCWYQSLTPLMDSVRQRIGRQTPTYLTFDIDGLDPSVAPGTGTPEPGGLTTAQGLEIVLSGLSAQAIAPTRDASAP